MEMLKDAAKIDMQHVPYKGNADSRRAILSGEVHAVFGSMPALLQNAKAGKVKPLAVGTATRSPGAARRADGGRTGLSRLRDRALAGHHGPGQHAQARSSTGSTRSSSRSSRMPEFKTRMDANGAEPIASKSPQEFTEMLRGQVGKY